MAALASRVPSAQQTALGLFPVTQVWTATLDSALAAPPAFDEQRGYFPLVDGRLVARDLATGGDIWSLEVAATVAPAAGDGLVFVAADDRLSAHRAEDGAPQWSIPASGISEGLVWRSGWLVAASQDGSVRAFRAVDGALIWRRELTDSPAARLTIAGERVYVPGHDGHVFAMTIQDGTDVWAHQLGGAAREVAATDDRVYVGSQDNYLYCLDAADGRELWRWRTGADIVGAPVVDERRVYFASLDNVLRALDRGSGAQRWKRALKLRPSTGPLLAGGTLVVSGLSPMLEAFAAADGQPAGEFTASGDLSAPPRVVIAAERPLPLLVVLSGGAARQTTIVAMTRSVEPPLVPVAPLPGLVQMAAPTTVP